MNRIFKDYETLSRAAAELFAECARRAVQNHGRFVVALSGGNTPKRAFEILALAPLRDSIDWSRIEVFWSDERCVPPGDSRRNSLSARRRLLDRVPIPADRIHPIEGLDSPSQAAAEYENQIRGIFGENPPHFDLIFLGLGQDGHTASLFPYSDILEDKHRWVRGVQAGESQPDRVSFTPVLINQAAVVAFLVSGEQKSSIVREIQLGPREPNRLPAQNIRSQYGKTVWLLDRKAASCLEAAEASRF
jgi:6-phosphogluconolactonase